MKQVLFTPGATLEISIHGFTILLGSDFMSNFMGSSAKILEIHGFTGTQGNRPNAAPGREFDKDRELDLSQEFD